MKAGKAYLILKTIDLRQFFENRYRYFSQEQEIPTNPFNKNVKIEEARDGDLFKGIRYQLEYNYNYNNFRYENRYNSNLEENGKKNY